MGRQAASEIRQTLGFVDDPELQAYVQKIGQAMAASSERPGLPWEFHVVDDPTPNAFALPGGFIYVTRGMMNLMTSEAELAGVLGHEIAHVTARHSVNQISKQQVAQLGLGVAGIFFPAVQEASPAIGSGLGLLFLKYGRDDERQADELGLAYSTKQGYAASEFDDVFEALGRTAGKEEGRLPDWLSTHPSSAERVETARTRAAALEPQAAGKHVGEAEFLRQIDGLVYGENPRHGFFRKNAFYHPDLRFSLTFPGGWQTQNLPQAVVAAAQDGSAAIELTLAPAETASQALAGFARQSGLQVGQPVRRSVNGLPAMGAEFFAKTQNGGIRGIAAFVEQGGRVYQIVGYGAAPRYAAYAPAVNGTIQSFQTVSDPEVLGVRANRIEIVQAPRDLTLAEFAKEFPSRVSVEQLAVINHLSDASARISRGSLVKRVVS